MKDLETLIADVEARWQSSTNEKREDMVKKLRKAEGALPDDDVVTRTRVASLIHEIQAAERHHDKEFVVPPLNTGTGFGFGATVSPRFDVPE